MEQKTPLNHQILNEMYDIINIRSAVDRWEALNALAIKWKAGEY